MEEYLALEQGSHQKYEYHDGEVFAMAGRTYEHSTISGNIFSDINTALRGKKCQVMNSDMKLFINHSNSYVYPDAMVICGEKERVSHHKDTFTNPVVIIEVLSESTAAYDRGEKFRLYRQIPSLCHYILIEQTEAQIDIYSRKHPNSLWDIRSLEALDSTLDLELTNEIKLSISLASIYERIEFEEPKS